MILIVDDNKSLLYSLKNVLTGLGYEVCCVKEPARALKMVRDLTGKSSPPEVLITDLRMPEICGTELIRQCRQVCPGLATILMTAYGEEKIKETVAAMERSRYLEKPFTVYRLIALIDELKTLH